MTPNLKGLPSEPLVVRVFCAPNEEAGGNPAPIVLQAHGMSSEDMRRIAESFGHEAGFVLPRSGDDHDLCMRYFVPNHEMEMCGHATVGALWLLREHDAWDGSPIRIRTLSGVVAARFHDGLVQISQPNATLTELDEQQVQSIAAVLRISPEAVVRPVINASTSRVKTLVQVRTLPELRLLQPQFEDMEAVCGDLGSTGLYPFALVDEPSLVFEARQFPKASGYPEDAATGIAATALSFGLRRLGLASANADLVTVRQGVSMGFPSEIRVQLPNMNDTAGVCWLSGRVQYNEGVRDAASGASIESTVSEPDARLARCVEPGANVALPSGLYSAFIRSDRMLFSSGVVARAYGKVITGEIEDTDIAAGQKAARLAASTILLNLQSELGSLRHIEKVVSLTGYLRASPSFGSHAKVMDGASELVRAVFPESLAPVRTSVGVASLPGNAAIEISMIFQLRMSTA